MNANDCWNEDLKIYIQDKIVGRSGHVFCAAYDLSSQSPIGYANDLAKTVFPEALENWFASSDDPKILGYKKEGWGLPELKSGRPDLVPLRYVVVANGASGLAVREYIQGAGYGGEISNVLFFDTPHEGSGFADQALFSKDMVSIAKKRDASSMAALIPLTLAAYVAGGLDGLREVMLSLVKDAVLDMAMDFSGEAQKALDRAYFQNFSSGDPGLWYLTQDADEDDPAYDRLRSQAGDSAVELLGGTQLLNSFSKGGPFGHPVYNVVYSGGFPSIGNGRRTLADFPLQDKDHLSRAKLKSIVADSLSSSLSEIAPDVDVGELNEQMRELADRLIEGDLSERAKALAGEIVEKYGGKVAQLQNILRDERLSGYLRGLAELRSMRWNSDDIPGSVLKIISVAEKFIPEEYRSELYSIFIDRLSPEIVSGVKDYGRCVVGGTAARACAKAGAASAAAKLSSYSLNFFDEGTFDVPMYSAFGENVAAFRESVPRRFGYAIDEIVEGNGERFGELRNYQKRLKALGELERTREIVDDALDVSCGALEKIFTAYGKICRAAEFAVNVGLMAEGSSKIREIAGQAGVLAQTREVAPWAAMKADKLLTFRDHDGGTFTAAHSDLDSMLHSAPVISVAGILRREEGSAYSVIPLMLVRTCDGDIYDYASLQSACAFQDPDVPYCKLLPADFKPLDFSSKAGGRILPVKFMRFEPGDGGRLYRRTDYGAYGYFVTDDFIREFRFQIDDVRPDSLRLVRLEFSSGARISYERTRDGTWKIFYGDRIVSTSDKGPADSRGLFVFRPEEILAKAGTTLSAAEEDGLNIVNVYAENGLGLSDSRQFSFFLQATEPLLEEGWPKNYALVSAIGKAHVLFGNLAYPFEPKHGGVRISRMEGGSMSRIDSVEATVSADVKAGSFRISADFGKTFGGKIQEGEYLLEWDVAYAYTDGSDETEHLAQTGVIVYVDTASPQLKWNLASRRLRGVPAEGKWATLENVGGQDVLSLRALRIFAVSEDGRDTVTLAERMRSADRFYPVGWPDTLGAVAGKFTLHAQAFGFSVSDEETSLALENLSARKDIWKAVLDKDGKFRPGINGSDVIAEVWIDRDPPEIAKGSLNVKISAAAGEGIGPGKASSEKLLLNSLDTLKISFDVRERIPDGGDSSEIRLDLIFESLLDGSEMKFTADTVTADSVFRYEFSEPAANRLKDGLYRVIVRLKDAARNVCLDTAVERLAVDRTPPVIAGVYAGDVAFESPSRLGTATAYVEQKKDAPANRSDLACYSKIDVAGISTEWTFLGTETESALSGEEKIFPFEIAGLVGGKRLPDGMWTVYLRCYDAAGNFGKSSDFFGMGAQYPQITNPADSLGETYSGDVVVTGVAPNPQLRGGDDGQAGFRIEWKEMTAPDIAWTEDGIVYLAQGVHSGERALAVWRIPAGSAGTYGLRLSVRACGDSALCPWISTVREIPVYDRGSEPDERPSVAFVRVPERSIAGEPDSVIFELAGIADTSSWTVKASVEVQSPDGSGKMVSGQPLTFEPVEISPFAGKPSLRDSGLSVWQDADRTWNVFWRGEALGLRDLAGGGRLSPELRIKHVRTGTDFLSKTPAASATDSSVKVPELGIGGTEIPGYDRISSWQIGGNELLIRFRTDSAFTIDLSTVENGAGLIRCGASGRKPSEIFRESYGTSVLHVHPDRYRIRITFDGLTQTGLYPGGEIAMLKLYAYDSRNLNAVIMDSVSWNIALGPATLTTSMPDSGEFFVGLADSESVLARQRLGFSYGLKGRSADVSAWILGPDGSVVRTLMKKSRKLAGSDPQAYSVSWDGMTDENFVAMSAGNYTLRLTAEDSGKTVSELVHHFRLRHAAGLAKAPWSSDGVSAELSMDEAVENGSGLRFAGNPDYLMRIGASAKYLPEAARTFGYRWEWDPRNRGVQYPAMYRTYRPSLGIWRQRDKFEATVAVLLMSYGYDIDVDMLTCKVKNKSYPYKILLKKMKFERGKTSRIDFEFDPDGLEIIAHDANSECGGDKKCVYPIVMGVKILPIYEFEEILDSEFSIADSAAVLERTNAKKDFSTAGEKLSWNDFWTVPEDKDFPSWRNIEIYKEDSKLYKWFSSWKNMTAYWEGYSDIFAYSDNRADLKVLESLKAQKKDCTPNLSEDADNSVCKDVEAEGYSHRADNMMTAYITAPSGKNFQSSKKNYSYCTEHSGSTKKLAATIHLSVNESYWDNSELGWGYNNLANRYVRFDPANKTLFGPDGYFGEDGAPVNRFDAATGEWEKCLSKKDCLPTAFEALKFEMENLESNPLLFPDEKESNHGKLRGPSLSRYWLNFFNSEDGYLAVMKNSGVRVGSLDLSEAFDYKAPKPMGSGYVFDPFVVSFEVAPKISAEDALAASGQKEAFDYPYPGDEEKFRHEIGDRCSEGLRCYYGFASRIHYGLGDWTEEDWAQKFLAGGYLRNPVTAEDGILPDVDGPVPRAANAMDSVFRYAVKPPDADKESWTVPMENLAKPSLFAGSYGVPVSGEMLPSVVGDPSGWHLDSAGSAFVNSGVDTATVLEFVRSKDSSQGIDRKSVAHEISLDAVLKQNPKDSTFASPWFQNVSLDSWNLYRRDSTEVTHPYLSVDFRQDSTGDFGNFTFVVSQKAMPLAVRVDEMATFRGRIPGKGSAWKLLYSKDGAIFPLASGVQDSVPEAPYPVLASAEMNRLQGNTSFFLTYGGPGDATYFRQLDVHVGTLITKERSAEVHSMYGNVSVNFPAGIWDRDSVDVTVRTVSPKDYNFAAFKGLDIVGPIVEVLPSHRFADSARLPEVKVMVMRSDIEARNLDASDLKIYKPDFESGTVVPLETGIAEYFDGNVPAAADGSWDRVWLKALTRSFSTFFVMDSAKASGVKWKDSFAAEDGLACGDMPLDTLWAGTANGNLEYPYPCKGRSGYLLQLRSGNHVLAEHRDVSASPIEWNARNQDFVEVRPSYGSRIVFYGADGKVIDMRGPEVRIDSVRPVFTGNASVTVSEEPTEKSLLFEAAASDVGSGISQIRIEMYFGGNLMESRTVLTDSVIAERFAVGLRDLYSCTGCRATFAVTAEDRGHNHSEIFLQSEPLYQYPISLALWYPFGEGTGDTAYEMTGSGLHMDLGQVSKRWMDGRRLHLFSSEGATSQGLFPKRDSASSFSVELKVSVGKNVGEVVGWKGSGAWTFGVDPQRWYYLESDFGRVTFTARAEFAVENHLVLTVEGNRATLYKNGTSTERKTLPSDLEWSGNGKLSIGKFTGKTSGFAGFLSDVRFYGSALTAEQAAALYRAGIRLDESEIATARAVDLERENLSVDQSCGIAGKAYLRQKEPASSAGTLTWNVDVTPGEYALYLKTMNYRSEESRIEIFVDGISRGTFSLKSTGLWESERVGNLVLGLPSGLARLSVRPIGNVGVAALALVTASKDLSAEAVDYGEAGWESPVPKISVQMSYGNADDVFWVRPNLRLGNLTSEEISGARIRYYYAGEGENVRAVSFYPSAPMRVSADAGNVLYGELPLTETIPAYGTAYYGNGPQIGLYRADYFFPWNATDDPSYAAGAEKGFVTAPGIAVLDADGNLLNDWSCYDADGPVEQARKNVVAYARDSRLGSDLSSEISLFVENVGTVAVEGFEVRYYYRRDSVENEVDLYSSPFAEMSVVDAGGNLGYVSFLYGSAVLNPGERSDLGNGVRFGLRLPGWAKGFDASDDPSHFGLDGAEFSRADSVLVLDLNGNLLWGSVPQPVFDRAYRIENAQDLISIESGSIYVDIPAKGTYTLETVNAAGIPLATLFHGIWNEGTHSVSISHTSAPGSYLVLRCGTSILSWKLFN